MSALAVVEPYVEPARPGRHGGDARGSAESRRRRREWLVTTFRADVDVCMVEIAGKVVQLEVDVREGLGELYGAEDVTGATWRQACRCYRCGALLTVDDVTVDRIRPGAEGGTYRRTNIRPACGFDNSSTGGALGAARKAGAR